MHCGMFSSILNFYLPNAPPLVGKIVPVKKPCTEPRDLGDAYVHQGTESPVLKLGFDRDGERFPGFFLYRSLLCPHVLPLNIIARTAHTRTSNLPIFCTSPSVTKVWSILSPKGYLHLPLPLCS